MKGIYNNILVGLMVLASCNSNTKKAVPKAPIKPLRPEIHSSTTAKKERLNNDTLMVNSKSAIVYQPDSLTIERLKIKLGEEDFYTLADDNNFYIATSIEHLEKLQVPVLNSQGKRFIQFKTIDKTPVLMRIDTITELGRIYLFEPGKQPYKADLTAMDTEAKAYYK